MAEKKQTMDKKKRAELIRLGNQAFNDGDYPKAQKLYLATGYRDGLIRMGDYWYREKRKPLYAYGFYRKAGDKVKQHEIMVRMCMALKTWVGNEPAPQKPKIELPNPPKDKDPLMKTALEILARENQKA